MQVYNRFNSETKKIEAMRWCRDSPKPKLEVFASAEVARIDGNHTCGGSIARTYGWSFGRWDVCCKCGADCTGHR